MLNDELFILPVSDVKTNQNIPDVLQLYLERILSVAEASPTQVGDRVIVTVMFFDGVMDVSVSRLTEVHHQSFYL